MQMSYRDKSWGQGGRRAISLCAASERRVMHNANLLASTFDQRISCSPHPRSKVVGSNYASGTHYMKTVAAQPTYSQVYGTFHHPVTICVFQATVPAHRCMEFFTTLYGFVFFKP